MTIHDYILKAHMLGDSDELSIFLDGFFTAAGALGVTCSCTTPIERQHWALNLIKETERKTALTQRAQARLILQQYIAFLRKEDYRGMIFNRSGIDTDGRDICYDDEPTSDPHQWEDVAYQHLATGNLIMPSEYNQKTEEDQKLYTEVRFYTAYKTPFTIYSSDTAMMSELIHHDILIGDNGVNQRYLDESSDPNSDLYRYRQIIQDALLELECMSTRPFHEYFPNGSLTANLRTHSYGGGDIHDDAEDDEENA